ncbi:glucoside xylosyltransferase 1 [Ischnura elegans]|uniref:glucoside xylosyltransferase 1 n=1 Tax=Ischnura elegans TaxID=197161 RepID=UPI001ED8B73B|nr:glucoside xylosyltransferase 1 [Ischnura elegans]
MKLVVRFIMICGVLVGYFIISKYVSYGDEENIASIGKIHQEASENPAVVGVNDEADRHYHLNIENNLHLYTSPKLKQLKEIVLAVVACGDRLDETLVMLKSALIFSQVHLRIIVIADDNLIPSFREKLKEWTYILPDRFVFEVHPINFPLQGNTEEWRKLFKPCAAQRLFLPTVLGSVDALLYVDTDTLFLAPLEEIWEHFSRMNSSQMAALTPEHEDHATGWYNRFARHPYYGPLGVNSGVMLMNLTRMRQFNWNEYVVPIYKEYKLKITWGDQDIINIIFHFHPDKLYIYPCRYNFRPDHCMYMSVCTSAEEEGVAVLHGNRGSFHSEKHMAFRAVYRAMEEYQLGTDPYMNLLFVMKKYLEETISSNCGKVNHIFTKAAEKFIQEGDFVEEEEQEDGE